VTTPEAHTTIRRHRRHLYLRVTITLVAWVVLIVYAHTFAHRYEAELTSVLASPLAKLAAATLFLTALVYFVVLSLPFLPNLGPRSVAIVLLWSTLLIFGHSVSHEGFHEIQVELLSMRDQVGLGGWLLFAAVYAIALAMPFVPGVEIGLLIIVLLGTTGAMVAYLATVGGLGLAYLVGRLLPEQVLRTLLSRMGANVSEAPVDTQLRGMMHGLPSKRGRLNKAASTLLDYRYLTLAVGLNFPGNSVVGGGGGLSMLCGMSRQFDWRGFLLTVAVATSPLPLLALAGLLDIQSLLEHHGFLHNLLKQLEGLFMH